MVATVYSRRPIRVRVPRAVTRLAPLASRAAVFGALLLGMTLLARRVGIVAYTELVAPLAVSAALAVVALVLAGIALLDCWLRGAAGGWKAIRAMALAGLVTTPFLLGVIRYVGNPSVSDVSTDPLDPPDLTAVSTLPAPTPADLATRRYDAAIERVAGNVRTALNELGWTETGSTLADDRGTGAPIQPADASGAIPVPVMRAPTPEQLALIEQAQQAEREAIAAERREEQAVLVLTATILSPVLHLPSDVVIRLRDDGERTTLDLRSRSREGRHDLGRNAALIRTFLAALDDVMARDGLR